MGEAHNIGTGTETSVLDIAETIQVVTDTDSEIVHTPPRPADIDHSVADISKARSLLGYEPSIDLQTGLEKLASHESGWREIPPLGLSLSEYPDIDTVTLDPHLRHQPLT